MRRSGFTLIEVIVAMAIAVLMLTILLSLEVKATALAAKTSIGIDTLPIAIDKIEDLTRQNFTGESTEFKGPYQIKISSSEILSGIPLVKVQVEVLLNGESYSTLSLYRFTL